MRKYLEQVKEEWKRDQDLALRLEDKKEELNKGKQAEDDWRPRRGTGMDAQSHGKRTMLSLICSKKTLVAPWKYMIMPSQTLGGPGRTGTSAHGRTICRDARDGGSLKPSRGRTAEIAIYFEDLSHRQHISNTLRAVKRMLCGPPNRHFIQAGLELA
ncbi:hypothetical protein BCR34DRAFT_595579 [Clohesyomyces aquaticus]|uniref:Uncharacterized protein n=1 Tax=Clohesyomyces aquaticus TaxID=1231657 RepID=A0A1Y2A9Z3_9PLEO|nr:hypothetical protein BCR34DRAFT_595579 [Clohesyomyces aquaticus]